MVYACLVFKLTGNLWIQNFFFHQVIMAKELAQTNTAARKKRTSCKAFMSSSYQNSVSLIPSPHLHRLFIVDCQWTLKKVRIYPSLNEFCWLAALDSACLLCTTQQKKTFFWMYDFDSLTITNCFRRGKNDHRYTNECKLFENRNEAKFTFDIEKWDVKLNINQVEEKMYNSLSLTIENPLCWEEEREASKNYCLIILSFTFFFSSKKSKDVSRLDWLSAGGQEWLQTTDSQWIKISGLGLDPGSYS